MKIPDAYIAQGGELGVPSGVPQFPLQAAGAEFAGIQVLGRSSSVLGAAVSQLDQGLRQARQKVRTDELAIDLENQLTDAENQFRKGAEVAYPPGSLVKNLPKLREALKQVSDNFMGALIDEDEIVKLGLKHNAITIQKSVVDKAHASYGQRDVGVLKNIVEQTTKSRISEVSTMPPIITEAGLPDLDNLSRNQRIAIDSLNTDVFFHTRQTGLLSPNAEQQLILQNEVDARLQTATQLAQSNIEWSRHVLRTIQQGKPIYGLRGEQLKPVRDAAIAAYTGFVNQIQSDYNLSNRAVTTRSDEARKLYEQTMLGNPNADIRMDIARDAALVEGDRDHLIARNEKLMEAVKKGATTSDFNIYNELLAEISALSFSGDPRLAGEKVLQSAQSLTAAHTSALLGKVHEAYEKQRAFSRAQSSQHAKVLVKQAEDFLFQTSKQSFGMADSKVKNAFGHLYNIERFVIANPDATLAQVNRAFEPLLMTAYQTLEKEYPEKSPSVLRTILGTLKEREPRQYFEGLLQRLEVDRKRKRDAANSAKMEEIMKEMEKGIVKPGLLDRLKQRFGGGTE